MSVRRERDLTGLSDPKNNKEKSKMAIMLGKLIELLARFVLGFEHLIKRIDLNLESRS